MASARPPRGSVSLPFQSWQDTKLPRGAPDPWASWGQGALLGQLEKGTDGLGLSSAEQWLPLGYKCPFLAKGLGRAWTPWGGEGASCGLFCRAGISSTTQHADPTLEHNTPQSASYSRDKEGRTAAPLSQEGLAPQPAAAGQLTGWLPAPQSSAPLWPWGLRFGSPAPAGQGLAAALGSRLVLDPGSGVPGRPMCCPVGGRTIRRHCLQAWAFTPRALSQPGPQKWPCGSSRSGAGSGEAGAGRGDQIRRGLRTGALSPPRAVFCGAGPHSLQVSAPLSALCCCVSLAPKERLHRGQKRPAAQPRLDFRRSLGGAGGGGAVSTGGQGSTGRGQTCSPRSGPVSSLPSSRRWLRWQDRLAGVPPPHPTQQGWRLHPAPPAACTLLVVPCVFLCTAWHEQVLSERGLLTGTAVVGPQRVRAGAASPDVSGLESRALPALPATAMARGCCALDLFPGQQHPHQSSRAPPDMQLSDHRALVPLTRNTSPVFLPLSSFLSLSFSLPSCLPFFLVTQLYEVAMWTCDIGFLHASVFQDKC